MSSSGSEQILAIPRYCNWLKLPGILTKSGSLHFLEQLHSSDEHARLGTGMHVCAPSIHDCGKKRGQSCLPMLLDAESILQNALKSTGEHLIILAPLYGPRDE